MDVCNLLDCSVSLTLIHVIRFAIVSIKCNSVCVSFCVLGGVRDGGEGGSF